MYTKYVFLDESIYSTSTLKNRRSHTARRRRNFREMNRRLQGLNVSTRDLPYEDLYRKKRKNFSNKFQIGFSIEFCGYKFLETMTIIQYTFISQCCQQMQKQKKNVSINEKDLIVK